MDVTEPTTPEKTDAVAPDDRNVPTISEPKRLSVKLQVILLVGLSAVLVAGLVFSRVLSMQETARQAEEQPAQTESGNRFSPTPQQWAGFAIAPVKDISFRPVQQTDGKIAFDDDLTTPVFSPFTGRVTRLFARMGDRVKRGDPLLAVQATEFVQGQNDLITSAATLKTARAQLNLAQTNEKRQHALYLAQGGALKDWQQSQVDLATAEGAVHSAEIAQGAVRNRLRILGKTDQEIDAIQNAPDTTTFSPVAMILAPIDGVVTQRQIGLGQNIISQSNGGSTPLFAIGDLSKVWLLGNAREADARLIHLDDPVEVRVPAYPGRVFNARISFVAPSIDPSTHRLPVRAEVDNDDFVLKPEMLASFRITTGSAAVSPAVPESALVYEGDAVHVWVANEPDKMIAIREIKIGRISDGMVQVLNGLHTGEKVVTAGSLFLDRAVTGD
ncbi:MAG: efflux RND transporter periplasmic adaptor subunit [Rhodopila sp.]|nr:efflux RND transporter periplasmic adaptor subunit [Rhodopila sp.]